MTVTTIPQMFLRVVSENPRPDCFSYKGTDGVYVDVSSAEAQRRVRGLRLALASLGVARGDRVAILSENRLEWALVDLAVLSLGAVDVPIYPTLLPDTIEYILRDCEPVAIFVSNDEQAAKVDAVRGGMPFLRDVIAFDPVSKSNMTPFEQLMRIGDNQLANSPQSPADDVGPAGQDDLCSIIYTSGTTGAPKGVMLSHWNFVSNVLAAHEAVEILPTDRVLSFLPLSHVLERMAGFYTMLHGGVGIAYAESVDTVAADMQLIHPTIMISVPRLYEKIFDRVVAAAHAGGPIKRQIFDWARRVGRDVCCLEQAGGRVPGGLRLQQRIADKLVFSKLRARTGGRLRIFVSGGAPLAPHINEFFYSAGMLVLEGYGLTETSPLISVNTPQRNRIGSIGPVVYNTEVRIAEDGEILARGPGIMLGYYNNETATREMIDADDWLHTGDIGHLDQDGYLYITDRKKDIIVTSGGKNVAPQPIENLLKKSKFISQVVVIGDKRPYLTCLVVPNFDELEAWAGEHHVAWSSRAELLTNEKVERKFQRGIDRVNAKQPPFSTIKDFALLEQEFTLEQGELTPTLKVKRRTIQEKFASRIEAMYSDGD